MYSNSTSPVLMTPVGYYHSEPMHSSENYSDSNSTSDLISEWVGSGGGIASPDSIQDFIKLIAKQNSEIKETALRVLIASQDQVFQKFVSCDGLSLCNDWLMENETNISILVLELLEKLTVTPAQLKCNGKIAKTVKKLRKHSDTIIQNKSKQLLKCWMDLVGSNSKKRQLDKKVEPPRKRFAVSTSNAFQAKEVDVKDDVVVVKRIAMDNRNKNIRNPTEKPMAKPLRNSTDSAAITIESTSKKTTTLRRSADSVKSLTKNDHTKNTVSPPKPLVSCIPDPTNRRKKRSISWADDSKLVKVRFFPRDKTLGINNPTLKRIQAARQAQQQQQQVSKQAAVPQMVASRRWAPPPRLKLPPNIKLPSGEQSTEVAAQHERERTVLKVFYPDRTHIPNSPFDSDIAKQKPPLRDEDIRVIPLLDLTKSSVPVPSMATPSMMNQPPPAYNYNSYQPPSHTTSYHYGSPPPMHNSYADHYAPPPNIPYQQQYYTSQYSSHGSSYPQADTFNQNNHPAYRW